MNPALKRISKFLSLVLRHQPELIGIRLDAQGWVDVETLIRQANLQAGGDRPALTAELLREVVETSDKQRFALSKNGLRIRANQGHSLRSVELDLHAVAPPEILLHGTVAANLESIAKQGLLKGARNHVHLSSDEQTARKVGGRRGQPVVLKIAAAAMNQDGFEFFLSKNEVWLTDTVPPNYLEFPQ